MYRLLRPLLFTLDPETAHNLTLALLRGVGSRRALRNIVARRYVVDDPRLEVEAFGLRFRNPVGLAAGYDKNGTAVAGLASLGFGHVEVGTVTRLPQPGQARPRVHRFPEARAVVNHMGFPNAGLDALAQDLTTESAAQPRTRVGVNIGKGKDTPLEGAAEEYCAMLRRVHERRQADYVALNISSPNTPGLRELQGAGYLADLLGTVARTRDELSPRLPVLVKIAPDLDEAAIDEILGAVLGSGMDGIIATNTTTRRDGAARAASVPGGLSGAPLRERATEVIRYIARKAAGKLPIIGVGGIEDPLSAIEKLRAGAWLIQVYTGLIYAGPGLVRDVNHALLASCEAAGLASVSEMRKQIGS